MCERCDEGGGGGWVRDVIVRGDGRANNGPLLGDDADKTIKGQIQGANLQLCASPAKLHGCRTGIKVLISSR